MDRFTSRRRATWQSKAPAWPFIAGAFVLTGVACWFFAPMFTGIIFGDGTEGGRLLVWLKTASNILLPAVIVGVAAGALLHGLYLGPAGRHTALKWTALLVLAGAVVTAPLNLRRGVEADRVGYKIRLQGSAWQARSESRRSEHDLYRRLDLLLRNDPFDPANLAEADGLETAREAIAGHKDLIEASRRDYEGGQVRARRTLSNAIAGEMDREAAVETFDLAAAERKTLIEALWGAHDRIIALREEELRLLSSNRAGWRSENGQGVIVDRGLLSRIRRVEAGLRTAFDEAREAEDGLRRLDAATDQSIDRILAAAK